MAALLSAIAACSAVKEAGNSVGGWFAGGSTLITTEQSSAGDSSGSAPKYAVTLRVSKYADLRKQQNPRLLGINTQVVRGVSGDQLVLDQVVASLVTTAIKKRFVAEGYQVLESAATDSAMFEVSGVIKELTLNVKDRDEISIAIETTLKDAHSGAVLWSGLVTQKNDRFAGVSGNSKDDVVAYLNKELRIVSNKTVEAVSASLMATQPGLFNQIAGTKVVPGVVVFVAPVAAIPVSAVPAIVPSDSVQSGSASLLLVNTIPPRAKIYLDGVYYGMSPLRVEKEPGVYEVKVKLKGYKTATEKVSVRKGDKTEMELNLEH